jgi:molybdate transport system regulatory protein
MPLHASVSFSGSHTTVGRDRIHLLAAVAREGSISAAARSVGLSYRAAWDAIDGMNTLFGQTLVEARTGGRKGGGARLTQTGIRVIETMGHLESELTRLLRGLDSTLKESGLSLANPATGFVMRTSARNALRGVIKAITSDAVGAEIAVALNAQATIHATITHESVLQLGLVPGREVLALIKASFISIEPRKKSARAKFRRNELKATYLRGECGQINTEIYLDLGRRTSLVVSMPTKSARTLRLKRGDEVVASFAARNVLLAID